MTDRMPTTRLSLLAGLRDATLSQDAWCEFVSIYQPAIFRFARSRGLQVATAEDLTQQVLMAAARKLPEWENEPKRGSLRAWLLTVIRNAVINEFKRRQTAAVNDGLLAASNGSSADDTLDSEDSIDWEYCRARFRQAAAVVSGQVSRTAWQCFWQTAVLGKRAVDVAGELEISTGLVYTNRCRVLQKLQDSIRSLEGEELS